MDTSSTKDDRENHVVAVLALVIFIVLFLIYCCWGSSCLRKLSSWTATCRRGGDGAPRNIGNIDVHQGANSPTIILLPHGRLLIVDGTVFARFHADDTGLDLLELRSHLLYEERNGIPRASNVVETDVETDVKERAPRSESQLPPSYDSIFSNCESNSPPSYSEVLSGTVPEESPNLENANERIVV